MSTRKVNLNTASPELLTLLVDDAFATTILQLRSGPDGAQGTDDDTPIQRGSVRDALLTATGSRQAAEQLAPFFDGRSATYEVRVEAEVGGHSRSFYAILGRASEREVQVLSFYWKE